MGYCYKLYDILDNSMYYIGSTYDIEKRKEEHREDCITGKCKLYKYFREHSDKDNMEFCIM